MAFPTTVKSRSQCRLVTHDWRGVGHHRSALPRGRGARHCNGPKVPQSLLLPLLLAAPVLLPVAVLLPVPLPAAVAATFSVVSLVEAALKQPPSQFNLARDFKRRYLERFIFSQPRLGAAIKCGARGALTALIWPRFVAPFRWHLRRLVVNIPHLPKSFQGFKILHLTDLHAGMTAANYLQRTLVTAMLEKPDLIAITGDLIDYRPAALSALDGLLPRLQAPAGVWMVFGNHDYHEYSWRHVGARSAHRTIHRRLRAKLQHAGVHVLCNASAAIRRGADSIYLVGLDELWTGRSHAAAAFAGVPPDATAFCLQHNPDAIDDLQAYPWDWMLCGHTHGGQVDLPLVGPLFVPIIHRKYLRGIFELADTRDAKRFALVSTGVGYGLPIRWFVRPESILITLRAGPAAYEWAAE